MRKNITQEEHVADVQRIHGDALRVVGLYRRSDEKIDYECPTHGIFSARPGNVVGCKSGCKKCYQATIAKRCRKTNEEYLKELEPLKIVALEPYVTALTKIQHRCPQGHIWRSAPNQILSGYGCPLCDKSQYKRRPYKLGDRTVLVQGGEGRALYEVVELEGVDPNDIATTKAEGLPTFRYDYDGRRRVYIPDFFIKSKNMVVEVKSDATLGIYDQNTFTQVQAKTKSVLEARHNFRLMVIYRGRNIDIGSTWITSTWVEFVNDFRRITSEFDRRDSAGRKRCPLTGRYRNASGALLPEPEIS